jgi:hypothetical protein
MNADRVHARVCGDRAPRRIEADVCRHSYGHRRLIGEYRRGSRLALGDVQ